MNKLKLDLETLAVDSFATSRSGIGRPGTVQAHQASAVSACGCENTVFTTRCYDRDGDGQWDSYEPGPSDYGCSQQN